MHEIKNIKLITALVTPYKDDQSIDYDVYINLVKRQIDAGVKGVVVAGTTGEGHLLDEEELLSLLRCTVDNFKNDLLIIGNTGSNNTRKMCTLTERAFKIGMDASLQINPYYGLTSLAGLREHFLQALNIGQAILYNVPRRTAQDIPKELVCELSRHINFAGIKECAGNDRIVAYVNSNVAVFTGNDEELYHAINTHGASGAVSVLSNLLPAHLLRVCNGAIDDNLSSIVSVLQFAPNPIVIKNMMHIAGLIKGIYRLPYVALDDNQCDIIRDLISRVDFCI